MRLVKRIWPDALAITIRERVPVARWQSDRLISNYGDVFSQGLTQGRASDFSTLPKLSGPENAAADIMDYYKTISHLLRHVGQQINELELSADYRWTIHLKPIETEQFDADHTVKVLVGYDHGLEKIKRFIKVYEYLNEPQQRDIMQVDLRYDHGLAIRWRDSSQQEKAHAAAFELAHVH